ncbi:E3 ubiquitin-protein ligase UPL3-like isoform X2 [Typha latifolia]|uniref:E3 ubiquitin-protein ligase UPL3-like isoform X2 n=1 Tax=Typha latifolia TaxID=4733 RepID=UPI003C2C2C22
MAVLSHFSFFSTGVQRDALTVAVNICMKIPPNAADSVMEAVPLLTDLLQYHDSQVLEKVSICLNHIAEAFATSPGKLDELCTHGMVTEAAQMISVGSLRGRASLSSSTYTGLIRLLTTFARGSPLGAKTLHRSRISATLKEILLVSDVLSDTSVPTALSRSPEQIYEIVNLTNELLPSLPQGSILLPIWHTTSPKRLVNKKSPVRIPRETDETSDVNKQSLVCNELLRDEPELLQQFGNDLLPVLTQIYDASINGQVRYKLFSIFGKLMFFGTSDMIESLPSVMNISRFLAIVLASKDPNALIPAIQIAGILMQKLPGTFSKKLVREGVIHAIGTLRCSDTRFQASSRERDSDSTSGSNKHLLQCQSTGCSNAEEDPVPGYVGSPPTSVEILHTEVSACAKNFIEKYFPAYPQMADVDVTDDLLYLKIQCSELTLGMEEAKDNFHAFDFSAYIEKHLNDIVTAMLRVLSEAGASTFELVESGIVAAFLKYFTCGQFGNDNMSDVNLIELRQQALRRYRSFIQIMLPQGISEPSKQLPMTILVQKLQQALSSVEKYSVLLTCSSSYSSASASLSGLSALSRPIKLRLCRAEGEQSIRDYSSNIVLTDPLASLADVEDFLWPKVQMGESDHKPTLSAGNAGFGAATTVTNEASQSKLASLLVNESVIIHDAVMDSQEQKYSSSIRNDESVLERVKTISGAVHTRNDVPGSAFSNRDTHSEHANDKLSFKVLGSNSCLVDLPEKAHDVNLRDSADDDTITYLVDTNKGQPSSGCSKMISSFPAANLGDFSSSGDISATVAATDREIIGGQDRFGLLQGTSVNGSYNMLRFSLGGKQLSKKLTVYHAISSEHILDDQGEKYYGSVRVVDNSQLWNEIFTITYEKANSQVHRASPVDSSNESDKCFRGDAKVQHELLLDSILQGKLLCDIEKSEPTYSILALLHILEGLNQHSPRLRAQAVSNDVVVGKITSLAEEHKTNSRVPLEEFINSRLTHKLNWQIQDAFALCTGFLPPWCNQLVKACPFLFPFETRRQYFYSTTFGLTHAWHHLRRQKRADSDIHRFENVANIAKFRHQKVRISRNHILSSAGKVMELFAGQQAALEVEYFGEVGTGLGPTLEFYTLLSHELQTAELGLWRSNFFIVSSVTQNTGGEIDEHSASDAKKNGTDYSVGKSFVQAPLGLFPRPWPANSDASRGSQFVETLNYFCLVGQVIAKALKDGRRVDLPFSLAFYKIILGQELDLYDILSFDAEFGKNLQEMQDIFCRKQFVDAMADDNQKSIADLHFHGVPIEDLHLDFTLPGYPDYFLKEEGNTMVNINNLEEYISLVVDATVRTGVMRQIQAFKAGFNQVFDISSLQIFSPHELDSLLCGPEGLWEPGSFVEHIKFDHGYTAESPAIVNLLEILGNFTLYQQRAFCQFVTGAPRFPPGGLAALDPKLTVVKKLPSVVSNTPSGGARASISVDDDLPSVMTCANYLKLPPYSTKDIMYKKLLYAINEGQGSFDLS